MIGKIKDMRFGEFSEKRFDKAVDNLMASNKITVKHGCFEPLKSSRLKKRKISLLDIPSTFDEKIEVLKYYCNLNQEKFEALQRRAQQYDPDSPEFAWLAGRGRMYKNMSEANQQEIQVWNGKKTHSFKKPRVRSPSPDASNYNGESDASVQDLVSDSDNGDQSAGYNDDGGYADDGDRSAVDSDDEEEPSNSSGNAMNPPATPLKKNPTLTPLKKNPPTPQATPSRPRQVAFNMKERNQKKLDKTRPAHYQIAHEKAVNFKAARKAQRRQQQAKGTEVAKQAAAVAVAQRQQVAAK